MGNNGKTEPENRKYPSVTVRVEEELKTKWKAAADDLGVGLSVFVKEAMNHYIEADSTNKELLDRIEALEKEVQELRRFKEVIDKIGEMPPLHYQSRTNGNGHIPGGYVGFMTQDMLPPHLRGEPEPVELAVPEDIKQLKNYLAEKRQVHISQILKHFGTVHSSDKAQHIMTALEALELAGSIESRGDRWRVIE